MQYELNSDCRLKLHLTDLRRIFYEADNNYMKEKYEDYILIELDGDSDKITILHPMRYNHDKRIKYI